MMYANKLNENCKLETFLVSENNKQAYDACRKLLDEPKHTDYDPILVYGGAGLGKTHLLQAMAYYFTMEKGDKAVYISCADFVEEMIDEIQNDKLAEFKNKYMKYDALLIDDIHCVYDREYTLKALIEICNTLSENGIKIILASCKSPGEIASNLGKVKRFFYKTSLVKLLEPDCKTRIKYLKNLVSCKDSCDISEENIGDIAEKTIGSYRELKGELQQLILRLKTKKQSCPMKRVQDYLKRLDRDKLIHAYFEYALREERDPFGYWDVAIKQIKALKKDEINKFIQRLVEINLKEAKYEEAYILLAHPSYDSRRTGGKVKHSLICKEEFLDNYECICYGYSYGSSAHEEIAALYVADVPYTQKHIYELMAQVLYEAILFLFYEEHAPKTGETQEGWDEDEENYYNAIELLSQANKDDENEEQCEEEQLKRLSAWMVAYKAERDYDKYCFEKELKALKQSLQ